MYYHLLQFQRLFQLSSSSPVVFQTREYGSAESYKELGFKNAAQIKAQVEREVDELFGPAPAE
mgnify:CR=1 FL=1